MQDSTDKMIDLGVMPKTDNGMKCCPEPSTPKQPTYPSLCVRDDQMDILVAALKKLGITIEMGEEITATVKLRVSGFSNQTYSKNVDFNVLAIGAIADDGTAEEDDEEAVQEMPERGNHKNPVVRRMKAKAAPKTDGNYKA